MFPSTVRRPGWIPNAVATSVVLLGALLTRPMVAQPVRALDDAGAALPETLAISADARGVAFATSLSPDRLLLIDLTRDSRRVIRPPFTPDGPAIEQVRFAHSGRRLLFSTARDDVLHAPQSQCIPPGDDCNDQTDVFRYDRLFDRTYRMSLTCFNDESFGACTEMASNGNGDRVAMVCSGFDLVPGDTNGQLDVFLRDDRARWTYRVSLSDGGGQANGPSGADDVPGAIRPSLATSRRGDVVAYVSSASNLVPGDTNEVADVFVSDVLAGRTHRVSVGVDGAELDAPSDGGVDMSGNGRYVVFASAATNGTPEALSPGRHVYLYDRELETTRLVSRQVGDCDAAGDSWRPSFSNDGLRVAFLSSHACLDVDAADVPSADEPHLYVWRRLDDSLTLADRGIEGGPADAPVLAYRLAASGDWALVQSGATDLVDAPPNEGDGSPWLYLVPTVPDRDADGLPDDWETDGIDLDGDGLPELDLAALGASPDRRDLFVEYDYLVSASYDHVLSDQIVEWLIDAFAAAPVANPDETTGITLHLDGTDGIPTNALLGRVSLAELAFIKDDWLGSAEQRADERWPLQRQARALVYRYGFIGHLLSGTNASGVAELPGDDFIVSLGAFDGGVGTAGQQAGTFLHELGHTLGLHHGGGDPVNCKPNYLSVMSYAYQFPGLLPERPLDFSRWRLPDLEENSLNESAGIGAPESGWQTVFGPGFFDPVEGYRAFVADADAPIDWNNDGDASDNFVFENVNSIYLVCSNSAGEYLTGYDDWANLVHNARGAADFVPGLHQSVVYDELTADDLEALRAASEHGDNAPPVAVAEQLGSAREGSTVRLDGLASFDPEGAPLRARWSGVADGGLRAAIEDPAALVTEARLPEVDGDGHVQLALAVHDGVFWSAPAFVTVDVIDDDRAGVIGPPGTVTPADPGGVVPGAPMTPRGSDASGGDIRDDVPTLPDVRPNGELPDSELDGGCGCSAGGGGASHGWMWLAVLVLAFRIGSRGARASRLADGRERGGRRSPRC